MAWSFSFTCVKMQRACLSAAWRTPRPSRDLQPPARRLRPRPPCAPRSSPGCGEPLGQPCGEPLDACDATYVAGSAVPTPERVVWAPGCPFLGAATDRTANSRRPLERETTPSRITRACVALIAGRGSNNMAKRAYSSCEHLDGMCEKRLYCCIMHLISTTARLKTAALQALELCCLWRRWHALAARTVLRVPRAATRLPCVCRPTWPASPADCWSPAARRRRPTVRSRRAPEPRSNAPAGRCCQSSLTSHGTILYHCWHKRRLCRLHLFPHICAHSPCAARPAAANSIAVLAATTCTTPPSIERRRRRRRRSRRAPPASCPAPWR